MLVGVADTNSIEPIAAGATVTVPFAINDCDPTVAVAVIESAPLQPRAIYDVVAMPVLVVTGLVTAARSWPTQAELNETSTGEVYKTPV
jgi:hypothetical protein